MSDQSSTVDLKRSYSGLRVLLAEDEPMAQKLALGALRLLDIKDVTVTADGLKALKALKDGDGEYQLIVSDWNMPELNGLEFLRAVRRIYPHIKFIMLTGNANKDFVVAARKFGVDAYIAKPFAPAQLRQKVEAIFRF
jgi:two-component system chemotaxis response regulator CheY